MKRKRSAVKSLNKTLKIQQEKGKYLVNLNFRQV